MRTGSGEQASTWRHGDLASMSPIGKMATWLQQGKRSKAMDEATSTSFLPALMGFHGIYGGLMGFYGILRDLPPGKRLHNYGKSPSSMGKFNIKPCSIAAIAILTEREGTYLHQGEFSHWKTSQLTAEKR